MPAESSSLSEPHTSCETERLLALGHFNLGNCTALDAAVAESRRRCGMERAVRTGVDWKPPPGGRFKPLSVSIPGMPGLLDCAWSRLS